MHLSLASEQEPPAVVTFSYLSTLHLVTVDAKSSIDAAILPQLAKGDSGSTLPTEAARQLLQGRRFDSVEGKGKPYRCTIMHALPSATRRLFVFVLQTQRLVAGPAWLVRGPFLHLQYRLGSSSEEGWPLNHIVRHVIPGLILAAQMNICQALRT